MNINHKRRIKLGVNIDHAATLRQARYATFSHDNHNIEPSIKKLVHEVESAGADSITIHLREDRRHIQDKDVFDVKEVIKTKLNLEMGNSHDVIKLALKVKPDYVCLVPENREEITTEGGLNLIDNKKIKTTIDLMKDQGSKVSLFLDPDPYQIEIAKEIGADSVELHTGEFANSNEINLERNLKNLKKCSKLLHSMGVQVNAGHGLNTNNLSKLLEVPHLSELNIGHHIISRSIYVGIANAIKEILKIMEKY